MMRNTLSILSLAGLTMLVRAGGAFAQVRVYADGWGDSPSISYGDYASRGYSLFNKSHGNVLQIAPSYPDRTPSYSVRYTSERSPHKFAGATRVVLDQFDRMDKAAKSALLQLDKNAVSFTAFGEQRVTTVFYQSFQVKLTRLNEADPDGRDRCIISVELPREYAAALGESSLRLVA